jgi:hypothetical protein
MSLDFRSVLVRDVVCLSLQQWVTIHGTDALPKNGKINKMMVVELNRGRQPFQNSSFQCFQQLQGLPWDCQTLENTGKTDRSWVIAVGDCVFIRADGGERGILLPPFFAMHCKSQRHQHMRDNSLCLCGLQAKSVLRAG